MIKKFFGRFGIRLSHNQISLVQRLLWFVAATLVTGTIFMSYSLTQPQLTDQCASSAKQYGRFLSFVHIRCENINGSDLPIWLILVSGAVFLAGFLPLLLSAVSYFGKLILQKKFREEEMAQSVDYLESDEREQLITMRATKRSYMVLNFLLLIGWLVSLVLGNFNFAVSLFVIQATGAMTFRRQINREDS